MSETCPRLNDPTVDPCPTCGASIAAGENTCPFSDLSPELSEGAPITAGVTAECEGGEVCESCQ